MREQTLKEKKKLSFINSNVSIMKFFCRDEAIFYCILFSKIAFYVLGGILIIIELTNKFTTIASFSYFLLIGVKHEVLR